MKEAFFGDSTFFDVFNIPLIAGNAKTRWRSPASVVMTEAAAKIFHCEDRSKTIRMNEEFDLQVTRNG
jgi:hypothetical protein